MSYVQLPSRTSSDANASADINQLQDNLDAILTGDAPTSGALVINEAGADKDFRVEASGVTHALFVEGSSGNVGIGTSTLTYNSGTGMTVHNGSGRSNIKISNNTTGTGSGNGTDLYVDGSDFNIINRESGTISFIPSSGTAAMIIDSSGNVGIGVTPESSLITGFTALEIGGTNVVIGNTIESVSNVCYWMQNVYLENSFVFKRKVTDECSFISQTNGDIKFYTDTSGTADASFTPTERMRIDSSGNVKVGGTADRGTTVGTAHIDIFNGTAPAGTLTNGVSLYSSSGEFYAMDAAGNATLNSPHDSDGNWIFYSKNTKTGRVLKVEMEKFMTFLNDHFGTDFIQEYMEEI